MWTTHGMVVAERAFTGRPADHYLGRAWRSSSAAVDGPSPGPRVEGMNFRQAKVGVARRKIAAGTYDSDACLDFILPAIIEGLRL